MPWNKPGNANDTKDPWTGQPKPPPTDLQALLRDWLKKITLFYKLKVVSKIDYELTKKIFSVQPTRKLISITLVLLLLTYFASGFFVVNPEERVIVTRFGRYISTLSPGYHWILKPIEARQVVYPTTMIPFFSETKLLTSDLQQVTLPVKLQYLINNGRQFCFYSAKPLQTVEVVTIKALQQSLGRFSLKQLLLLDLSSLQQSLLQEINQSPIQRSSGLVVHEIKLGLVQFPNKLKSSITQLTQAQSDKEKLETEANAYAEQVATTTKDQAEQLITKAINYRNAIVLKAKEQTDHFLALLPAYEKDPFLTKERLYLEARENLVASHHTLLIDNTTQIPINVTLNVSDKNQIKKIMPIDFSEKKMLPNLKKQDQLQDIKLNRSTKKLEDQPIDYGSTGGY